MLDKRATLELRAFVSDAYGLYYLRRGKSSAALDYVQKAMKTHARMQVSGGRMLVVFDRGVGEGGDLAS